MDVGRQDIFMVEGLESPERFNTLPSSICSSRGVSRPSRPMTSQRESVAHVLGLVAGPITNQAILHLIQEGGQDSFRSEASGSVLTINDKGM